MNVAFIFSAMALLMLSACNGATEKKSVPTLDELFASRRSVRSYKPGMTISESQIRELFSAVQNAPSWANQQPSKYYAAISPEKHDAILEMIGENNKEKVRNAPALIVSTFENGKSGFFRGVQSNEIGDGWGAHDNGLSNAYMVLKAREMGFDTLIMGIREADKIRGLFGIPENETIMAVIALGYRAVDPDIPVHKPLDEIVKIF